MISDDAHRAIRQLRKTPPFGADGFDLARLRRIMSARRDPADASVRCAAWSRGRISGHWVLAETRQAIEHIADFIRARAVT